MRIERVPLNKINPAPYNPRRDLKPGDPDYEKLKRSIDTWGLVEPLVWNKRTGNLVGGHQRLKILQEQDVTEVEVSVVDLDQTSEKALNVALNKIEGDWEPKRLAALLEELDAETDLTLTGFGHEELDRMLTELIPQDLDALLDEYNVAQAIEKPIWLVARGSEESKQSLEAAASLLEAEGIRVERSYEAP
jgi:ParB-like chromosome segregation protein Spo0J